MAALSITIVSAQFDLFIGAEN